MVKQICLAILKFSGWKIVNNVPDNVRSFVFIGAPHTSNHDFVPAMAMAYTTHLNARFVIKNDWMKFPLNLFFGPIGAIGLDRKAIASSGTANTTEAMADLFKKEKDLVLMISPEGTRSPRHHWKTGFYYIAQKAGVPIALGYADYTKKEAGIGMLIYPTDFEADMRKIMDFYRGMQGKNPENFQLDERFSK